MNYFGEKIKKNEIISKIHKKDHNILNYTAYLLILHSAFLDVLLLDSSRYCKFCINNEDLRNGCRG